VARAQVVKQADVLMLHHLLSGEVAPESLAANLDFYEPRTAHGSSLSPGIHASLLARAGRVEAALGLLRIAAAIDVEDLSRTSAGGVHLAAMGSVWQALAFGFAGFDPLGDVLTVDPRLPASWRALELGVQHHGVALRVRIEPHVVAIVADAPVELELGGDRVHCARGRTEFPFETQGGAR
jgi:trehalose/maltose hydrolase-like predicted phosphorylase